MKHQLSNCGCGIADCFVCQLDLELCRICNGAEVTLTTDCPEKKLTKIQEELILSGDIDFFKGRWFVPSNK